MRPQDRWQRLAVTVWVVMLLAVSARVLLTSPRSHTVYPIFAHAGQAWLAGADLYEPGPGLDQFRYPPPAAVAFAPWTVLPERLVNLLWRLGGAAVFLAGLEWWRRAVLPVQLSGRQCGLLYLLVVPLALPTLANCQLNLFLVGLLLAGTAAVASERWTCAAVFVALGAVLKLYPVALGLLLAANHPRKFAPRFALAVVAVMALPFLFQDAGYVAGQYGRWVGNLGADDRLHTTLERCTRDLHLLWRVWWGMPPIGVYRAVQLGGAAAVALVCLAARRAGWPARDRLALLFDLACLWMILLGQGAESCTYTILAPTAAGCLLRGGRGWLGPPAAVAYALLLATILAGVFPGDWRFQAWGPQPLAALLLLVAVTAEALRHLRRPPAPPDLAPRLSFTRLPVTFPETVHDRSAVADHPGLQRGRAPAAVPVGRPPAPD
jgi:hypothetical protein